MAGKLPSLKKTREKVRRIDVFDLDGTLIDDSQRMKISSYIATAFRHSHENNIRNRFQRRIWRLFYDNMYFLDKPLEKGLKHYREALENDSFIVILTARPKTQLNKTRHQLKKFDIRYDKLILREDLDQDSAYYKAGAILDLAEKYPHARIHWHENSRKTINKASRLLMSGRQKYRIKICKH